MAIATVLSITGRVWARDEEGNVRELSVGDTLLEGEVLVTSDNGSAQLDFGDGLDPTLVEGGEQITMTPELETDGPLDGSEFAALDDDLEALLTAIDEGEGDLLDLLEAPAAGPGAGGGGGAEGGGHNFVRLARIAEEVNPLAFEYGLGQISTFDFPEGTPTPEEGEAVLEPEPVIGEVVFSIQALNLGEVEGEGGVVYEGNTFLVIATVDVPPSGGPLILTLSNGLQIVIPEGATSGSVEITTRPDDPHMQGAEDITLIVSGSEGGGYDELTIGEIPPVTVIDDSDVTTITLEAPEQVTEGEEITVIARVDNAPETDLEITLSNGQTITIVAGATEGSVTFASREDDEYLQGTETLNLSITGTEGGNYESLNSDTTVSIDTVDDSDITSATLTSSGSGNEDHGSVTYTVTLPEGAAPQGEQSFQLTLSNNQVVTITVPADALTGSVTLAWGDQAGEGTVGLEGYPNSDVYLEDDFELAVTEFVADGNGGNYENLAVTDASEAIVIGDTIDTVTATLSSNVDEVAEGGEITYTVTLTDADGIEVTAQEAITFTLANGETITIGADESSGTVTITAPDDVFVGGQPTIENSIRADEVDGDGNFERLITTGETSVSVTDEPGTPENPGGPNEGDAITVSITADQPEYKENEAPTFTVSISEAVDRDVVVTLDNGDTVTIAEGATEVTYTHPAQGDDVYQDGETLTVGLAGATGADGEAFENLTLGEPASTQIVDTIDTTTLTLGDISVEEGVGTATLTGTLSNPAGQAFTVTLSNGATISFAEGETVGTSTPFAIQGDDVYVDGESYEVSVTDAGDHNFEDLNTDDTATVTVADTIDTTTISINATVTKTSVINVGNVEDTDSFTVKAYDGDGNEAVLSKVTGTNHDGFGVHGETSGSADERELGYVGDDKSESIVVEFNNEVQSFDVQFAWRANSERAKVEFFDADGNSVGWAIVSGGGENSQAWVRYYDAQGVEVRAVRAQGGSDEVDLAYTFEPGSGLTFTKAEFTAVGHDDDYLIHSIAYREVMDGDAISIPGDDTSAVTFEIQTSNPPDPSKYDFEDTFPTAIVEIAGEQYTVTLDRNGRGTVSVETDGSENLTATVIEVNGNFEDVAVPTELTLRTEDLTVRGNSDNTLEGGDGNDIIVADAGGTEVVVGPGQNYNIALIIDRSNSMKEASGTWGKNRMELLKDALGNLAETLADHDGVINLSLIGFATHADTPITFNNLTPDTLQDLLSSIDSLNYHQASQISGTNYEAAFLKTVEWFNGQSAAGHAKEAGFENVTYFLTDGVPTQHYEGRNNNTVAGNGDSMSNTTFNESKGAFAGLGAISKVHGIGIGNGIPQSTLAHFDNTGPVIDIENATMSVIADFNSASHEWSQAENWTQSGSAEIGRSGNRWIIADNNNSRSEE